jgi:excisionase family DNA binding protein
LPTDPKEPRRERRHPETVSELSLTTQDVIRRRKLWPLPEAAALLATTRVQLYRWNREGTIAFTRIGTRVYISDSELDRFVARAEVRSAAASQDRAG